MYMNPCFREEVLQAHYLKNSSGDVYHESFGDSRHGKLNGERKRFIEHHIANPTPGRFLDIGCGQGELLGALELDSWEKFGLEPSDAGLRTSKDYVLIPETLQSYESQVVYDAISCISSLEHFSDPVACLNRINRILKLNGYLFVEVPDTTRAEAQIAEFFSFEHLSHFTKATLEKMLSICGFHVLGYDLNLSAPNIRCVAKKTDRVPEIWDKRNSNGFLQAEDSDGLWPVIENYK